MEPLRDACETTARCSREEHGGTSCRECTRLARVLPQPLFCWCTQLLASASASRLAARGSQLAATGITFAPLVYVVCLCLQRTELQKALDEVEALSLKAQKTSGPAQKKKTLWQASRASGVSLIGCTCTAQRSQWHASWPVRPCARLQLASVAWGQGRAVVPLRLVGRRPRAELG